MPTVLAVTPASHSITRGRLTGSLFRSRQGEGTPMTRQNVWQIYTRLTNAGRRRYADRVSW